MSADADQVTSVLVDTDLPSLGPISSRVMPVSAATGGIADAVVTALGIMRVQAMQNDLHIAGIGVVCDNAVQCELVKTALATESEPIHVVDVFDPRMAEGFEPEVAAAVMSVRFPVQADAKVAGPDRKHRDSRFATLPVMSFAVGTLAFLGATAVWAVTSDGDAPAPATVGGVEVVLPSPTTVPRTTLPVAPAAPETTGAATVPTYRPAPAPNPVTTTPPAVPAAPPAPVAPPAPAAPPPVAPPAPIITTTVPISAPTTTTPPVATTKTTTPPATTTTTTSPPVAPDPKDNPESEDEANEDAELAPDLAPEFADQKDSSLKASESEEW